MANYMSTYRTNYFKVTDEDKYQELFERISAEDIEDFSENKNGEIVHGFAGYGCIDYLDEEEDFLGMDTFFEDLSKILPDEEAVIFTEIGHENLRYLQAYSIVATNRDVKIVDLQNIATDKAKEMLNNKDFQTELSY